MQGPNSSLAHLTRFIAFFPYMPAVSGIGWRGPGEKEACLASKQFSPGRLTSINPPSEMPCPSPILMSCPCLPAPVCPTGPARVAPLPGSLPEPRLFLCAECAHLPLTTSTNALAAGERSCLTARRPIGPSTVPGMDGTPEC